MAVITLQRRLNVRRALALRNHIVVTTAAGTNDLRMIHGTGCNRRPGCWTGLMTRIARIG